MLLASSPRVAKAGDRRLASTLACRASADWRARTARTPHHPALADLGRLIGSRSTPCGRLPRYAAHLPRRGAVRTPRRDRSSPRVRSPADTRHSAASSWRHASSGRRAPTAATVSLRCGHPTRSSACRPRWTPRRRPRRRPSPSPRLGRWTAGPGRAGARSKTGRLGRWSSWTRRSSCRSAELPLAASGGSAGISRLRSTAGRRFTATVRSEARSRSWSGAGGSGSKARGAPRASESEQGQRAADAAPRRSSPRACSVRRT